MSLAPAAEATGEKSAFVKKPTGIGGFDDMSGGGLPAGRLSLIVGSAGAGKTVFAMHCLTHRLAALGEPGIFVSFEESPGSVRANMASFAWGDPTDIDAGIGFIDARVGFETQQSGDFDLSGLLAGLGAMAAETGAGTVVFDGIDVLLAGLDDLSREMRELARLEEWIGRQEISALLTAKSFGTGERDQRRSERLQYMTDCVVILERMFTETTASRAVRISKYRGSGFAANPVPAVISSAGFEIVALMGSRLDYPTYTQRVSCGVDRLDALLDGGYVKGSCVLISGSPGTSKTSLGGCFAAAACARGEKVLFVSFDESGAQIVSHLRSIGLALAPYVASGALLMSSQFSATRSPEDHFVTIRELMRAHAPDCMVIDPLSALLKGNYAFAPQVCESLLDQAKSRGITVVCTSLLDQAGGELELSASHVSTIADTWMHVSYVAREGERNRALTIVKSRGTAHTRQVRELILSAQGVDLCDVYVAEGEVLMGSARQQKEAEMRRRQMESEMSHALVTLQAERDIAELKGRLDAVRLELEWRQREAAMTAAIEAERLAREREAASVRVGTRLSGAEHAGANGHA